MSPIGLILLNANSAKLDRGWFRGRLVKVIAESKHAFGRLFSSPVERRKACLELSAVPSVRCWLSRTVSSSSPTEDLWANAPPAAHGGMNLDEMVSL